MRQHIFSVCVGDAHLRMSTIRSVLLSTRSGSILFERSFPNASEGEQLALRAALREATSAAVAASRDDVEHLSFAG